MAEKKDIKEKIRKIYEVLPKLDDQRCGYKTCGEFARAVAEGKAPCAGCVSGGPEVTAKVCEIMGVSVPEEAIPQLGTSPGFRQTRLSRGRGMGRGRGIGRDLGIGRNMGRGSGVGRGRHGR
jgi:Na+-translocating ferredoxin:NAD+ oxidoreductase RNF subunit RnfB